MSPGQGLGWEMLQTGLTVNIKHAQGITLLVPLLITGLTQCGVGAIPADMAFLETIKAYQQIALFLFPVVKFCIIQSYFHITLEWGGRNSNLDIPSASFPQG